MRHCCLFVAVLLIVSAPLFPQRRVDPRNSYHRVIAVVPLIGSGTPSDPFRGKYVPTGQPTGAPGTGIIAFATEPTDDRKRVIVELVAVDRAALVQILEDHEAGMLAFEKGAAKAADIEAGIRQFRKDFSLQRFGVMVQ